jgi:hypothetical protein
LLASLGVGTAFVTLGGSMTTGGSAVSLSVFCPRESVVSLGVVTGFVAGDVSITTGGGVVSVCE